MRNQEHSEVAQAFVTHMMEELKSIYPNSQVGFGTGQWPEVQVGYEDNAVAQVQGRPDGVYVGGQRFGIPDLLEWESPDLVERVLEGVELTILADVHCDERTLEIMKGGDGSISRSGRPTGVRKSRVQAFPTSGCLFCCVEFERADGPVGHRYLNRAAGWAVRMGGEKLSPTFKKLKLAMKWAEERYHIVGWYTAGKDLTYKQHYAVPAPVSPAAALQEFDDV